MESQFARLNQRQRELLNEWLPDAVLVKDHSWGPTGTTVLEVTHAGAAYVLKAGDVNDHHLAREIRAHREWMTSLTSIGGASQMICAHEGAKLFAARFLPGTLVEGTDDERSPDIYRQAGVLLARFHGQLTVDDNEFEERANERTLNWLEKPHQIDADVVVRLRRLISSWPTPSVPVVPTHGDWQPRNWLADQRVVSVIDFGRADLRPAMTDFARLAAQQFRNNAALEEAFLEGYGDDPRESASWHRTRIREAVGTAAWAYQLGDHDFERQGQRMIKEALADAPCEPD